MSLAIWQNLKLYTRTVSHELRSPLTPAKLANDTLERIWQRRAGVEDMGAETKSTVHVIRESMDKAEALIRDLLALAAAGEQPAEVETLDVGGTVRDVLEDYATVIREKGVKVETDPDPGEVVANPTHLYQVFSNLIGNAVVHGESEKQVIEIRKPGTVEGSQARYLVRDNGPGFPRGEEKDIFLPFYKGKNGHTGWAWRSWTR